METKQKKEIKKLVLGVTAVEAHELTATTMGVTFSNASGLVTPVVIDNASKRPYKLKKGVADIIRNSTNKGSFYPLLQLYKRYPKAEVIGIMHNDCAIYEKGWDAKIMKMFKEHKKLGVVGLFGWQGVDKYGVDQKPIGNPFEEKRPPGIKYRRVKELTPAVTLDSMCMFFRRDVIPFLDIKEDILIRHGYDKIWPMRLHAARMEVGVTGFSFQHKGMAAFNDPEYHKLLKKWYDKRWNVDFPVESVEGLMLFEGRILLVNEFKNDLPCQIKK